MGQILGAMGIGGAGAAGGTLGGIGSAAASAGPALGGATTLASTAAPAIGGLGSASGAAASAVPMMGAVGPSMSGLATMGSQGPVQGGALGKNVGQMQAGPMGLGPANAQAPQAPKSASSWWDEAGKWIMENPESLQMVGQMGGGGRIENPPPEIGPIRFNNAPIQSGVNAGQMGLARLSQSYGRR